MDGKRFDNLSKVVAAAPSRRAVLKGLIGGIAAGLTGLTGRGADAQGRSPNGSACTRGPQCASFRCVDGVCCDGQCTGQCEACNVAGMEGACTPVSGAPAGDRPPCPGSGPCAATCDGVTTTSCAASPGADVLCGDPTCAAGWQTTWACGGNGSCHPTTSSCGAYTCDAAARACLTSCAGDADCTGDGFCDVQTGACFEDRPVGEPCTAGAECGSGVCAQSVCCASACPGGCQACNVPGNEGFCTEIPDDGPCDGGACCDGECVDTTTSLEHCGQCGNACRLTPAPGSCENEPSCETGNCAFTPRTGQSCGTATCIDPNTASPGGTCTDQGVCQPGEPVDCGFYRCTEGTCLTACVTNSDCAGEATCDPTTGECRVCDPACDGKDCGVDGCGGSCGDCGVGQICDGSGTCADACRAAEAFCGDGATCCDELPCVGDICCPADQVCGETCCIGGSECTVDGICGACGALNERCCAERTCDDPLECDASGLCGVCGGQDERCCFGNTCDDTLECTVNGTCGACGGAGQLCCFDVRIDPTTGCDAELECTAGFVCGACGDAGEACCFDDSCDTGQTCNGGACEEDACEPTCDGKTCGDDGCGGSCGSCFLAATCVEGQCQCPNGLVCPAGEVCILPIDGQWTCAAQPGFFCNQPCDSTQACLDVLGPDAICFVSYAPTLCGMPAICGLSCEPDCDGKTCGDNGCAGSCGACDSDQICVEGACQSGCGGAGESCAALACCDSAVCIEDVCCPAERACGEAVCCSEGQVCDVKGACVASCGQENETCCSIAPPDPSSLDLACAGDLDCTFQGMCVSNACGGLGEACCTSGVCDERLICSVISGMGTCGPVCAGPNEACGGDIVCCAGGTCVADVCLRP